MVFPSFSYRLPIRIAQAGQEIIRMRCRFDMKNSRQLFRSSSAFPIDYAFAQIRGWDS